MIHPLKVTSTLADETRFQIYEFLLQQKKGFSVQDIADRFNIHPNVARLHLTKLSEVNVITADFVKTGKGGRPGRVYKASEEGVVLSFPKRDESHVMKWTLQLVDQLGDEAVDQLKAISYKDGYEEIQSIIATEKKYNQKFTFNEKLSILTNAASLIGYFPQISDTPEGKKLIFTIYNCPFKNQLSTNNEIICTLHESYLQGQIDALFTNNEFIQTESMIHDCDLCQYNIYINETSLI